MSVPMYHNFPVNTLLLSHAFKLPSSQFCQYPPPDYVGGASVSAGTEHCGTQLLHDCPVRGSDARQPAMARVRHWHLAWLCFAAAFIQVAFRSETHTYSAVFMSSFALLLTTLRVFVGHFVTAAAEPSSWPVLGLALDICASC